MNGILFPQHRCGNAQEYSHPDVRKVTMCVRIHPHATRVSCLTFYPIHFVHPSLKIVYKTNVLKYSKSAVKRWHERSSSSDEELGTLKLDTYSTPMPPDSNSPLDRMKFEEGTIICNYVTYLFRNQNIEGAVRLSERPGFGIEWMDV